ncbi:MAG TPA: amino acid adenylation domain-containing protein [Thermoanaerobaculia bacterium]|nr:amino acid adenylation domain-containing protein [Thermoanaerobaculia bacterium]
MKNVEDIYPLSPLQQGLLFHSILSPASGVYVNQSSSRLRGGLDPAVFRETWQRVVDRYAILRTAFVWEGLAEPIQAVRQRVRISWRDEDWRELSGDDLEARLNELREAERFLPFDLAKAPLMRFVLVRVAEDEHEFVWTFHHILLDGWSTPLLLNEVLAIYTALSAGRDPELPPAPRFRDYIAWLKRQDLATAEAFWRRTLAGFTEPTPLGIGRPGGQSGGGMSQEQGPVSPQVTAALQAFAARHQMTLNTLVLGSWGLLLGRYSGEADVLFGSVVSGRPVDLPGVESMVGLFINTLPVRVAVPGEKGLLAWLQEIQRNQLELRQHEHSPLVQIQKWSDLPPGSRMFDSLFVFENYPTSVQNATDGEATGLRVVRMRSVESTGYPLTLAAWVAGDLVLRLSYDPHRFEPPAARRLLGHLASLLGAIASGEDRPLAELPLMTAEEERQIEAWNDTRSGWDLDVCLHALIEARVDLDPPAVAVTFEGTALTYRELDERANRLAHRLIALGAGPEQRVALFLERSAELIVALLAVLKSGAAYLPLDPDHPAERVAFQAADTLPAVLLTQEHLARRLPPLDAPVLVLSPSGEEVAAESAARPDVRVHPDHPAYVLYTSGSTGRPKGVAVPHRAIVNRLLWMQDAYGLTVADRVLQKTPYSFDVSAWEFFWPLIAGARLVVAAPGTHGDSAWLVWRIREDGITVMHFVPSMLRPFLEEPGVEACRSLRDVMASGEALPSDLARRFFARLGARLHNLYGPTEAAVDVTSWACEPGSDGAVPIGRPIANTRICLLDRDLSPVPVGVAGELYIGGVNLARGYFRRPGLTAERFVPDRAAGRGSAPGARLYRTGDLARYREDGAIEYLGRTDHQVKVRGFRIELGEIEATLLTHTAVREVAVAAPQRPDGHRRLVAYIVGDALPGGEELRRFLLERLPEYMAPFLFVPLERLPLSSNGKIDRRALPEPDALRPELAEAFALPEGPGELALAKTWSEVLQVERVGRNDNFFALGGDSILSLQVLSKAREQGLELSLQQIFQYPTIRELAAQVGQGGEAAAPLSHLEPFELLSAEDRARLPESLEDAYPLAMLQTGMLFHGELGPESSTYHNTVSVHLSTPFDLASLDLALQRLASRHPLLRTSFSFTGFSEPLQLVHRHIRIPLEVYDLRPLSPAEQEEELERWFQSETHRLFDWREAPLIRFHVHRRAEDRFQLSWSEHHAILDGWSVAAMMTELGQDYLALIRHGPEAPEPPTSTSRFRDFVALERQVLADDEARRFWLELLRDATFTALPRVGERAPEPPRIVSLQVPLPPEIFAQAQSLANRAGVPLKNVLLAVHARVLGVASGQADLVFGVVNNGRLEEADAERAFGLYLNTLPYRLRLDDGPWLDLVRQSFEMERAMLPFRRFPLAEIQRLAGGRPLFEVAFTYMNFHVLQSFASMSGEMQTLGGRNHVPTNFPLSVYFESDAFSSQLRLSLDYDASQLTAGQIQALAGFYQRALSALVERPESRYAEESLLSEAERHQALAAWNPEPTADLPTACLHELFEQQVERTPEAVALVYENERWTYRELNRRANRLAHWLLRLDVGPEVLVGLFTNRSPDLVVGLLGILKAGGAYLPLDPAYPGERLTFLLNDSRARLVVTDRELASRLPETETTTLVLDGESPPLAEEDANPPRRSGPGNLAYVIYTSGSTGKPKGVLVSHQNVVRLFQSTDSWFHFSSSDVWTLFHSAAFDFSVWEIWGPLLHGGKLVLVPYLVSRSPLDFLDLLGNEGVTVLNQTPSAFRQLAQAAEEEPSPRELALRLVVFGGEALDPEDLRSWCDRRGDQAPHLVNMYGITETTVHVTYRRLLGQDCGSGSRSLIGGPIPDLRLYVVDRWQQPVPVGVPGELLVGGAGLSKGYLRRPDLTAERFVPDAFTNLPGARLYRSGDLVCRLPDGDLEYLGRIDQQVKVRGFRIELGEIEAALREHPAIQDAAVLLREDDPGDQRIVAYIVPDLRHEESSPNEELALEQVVQWQMVFDQTYETTAEERSATSDFVGWNSSYTGEPIAPDEMQEWVDSTVERILSLAPESILEIGCGTGLLLSRLASRCSCYWATDFSEAALSKVRGIPEVGDLPGLRLFCRDARDFDEIPQGAFDVVLLNSVVQYFPSVDYLVEVIQGALGALREGGFLFLGDIRSLPLLEAFHTSVVLHRAGASLPIEQVRRRVQARISEDGELVLSPGFFRVLAKRLPRIRGARILLKRGRHSNEMIRYRYDVILLVGGPEAPRPAHLRLDWRSEGLSLEGLDRLLRREQPEALELERVPNARVSQDIEAAKLLRSPASLPTVGDLRAALTGKADAVDPEDLWSLAGNLGYDAEIGWAGGEREDYMSVFLHRRHDPPRWIAPLPEDGASEALSDCANQPLRGRVLSRLIPQLHESLQNRMPEYMVPSLFVLLEDIPLTPHGKLDRRALPAPERARPGLAEAYAPPRSPSEQKLTEIWKDVLKLDRVGIHDNFFEIGGHSLLATQIIVRIREAFQIDLPLRLLYGTPTVADLAMSVVQQQAELADAETLEKLLASIEQMPQDLQNLTVGDSER